MADDIEVTDFAQSMNWQNVAVPWAFVELAPDTEVTSGSMNLTADIVTYGDTVMAELVEPPVVTPPKAAVPPRAG